MISYTQKEAGFETTIQERVLQMLLTLYKMCSDLKKDLVIEGADKVILADTSVNLCKNFIKCTAVLWLKVAIMVLNTFKAEY